VTLWLHKGKIEDVKCRSCYCSTGLRDTRQRHLFGGRLCRPWLACLCPTLLVFTLNISLRQPSRI